MLSQITGLFQGMGEHEKKKADAVKSSGKPGRMELSKGNMHNFPGVKVVKRNK